MSLCFILCVVCSWFFPLNTFKFHVLQFCNANFLHALVASTLLFEFTAYIRVLNYACKVYTIKKMVRIEMYLWNLFKSRQFWHLFLRLGLFSSPKICLAQTSFAFLDLVGHAESLRFAQRLLLPFLTCQNWCAPKTLNFFSAREQSYTYGWVRKYVDFWCSLQTVYQTSAVSCLTQRPNDLCWFGDKPTRCGCAICWSSSCEFLPKICRVLCNKDGITCRNNTKFHLCAEDRACGVFLTSGAAILRNGIAFPPISVLVKLTNSMFSSGLPPKIGFTSGFEGWGWVKKIDCKYWQSFCCKTLRFCCGCSLRFGTGLVILVPGLSKSPMSMERICGNTSPD